jgi:hypothetical protein
MYNLTLGQNGHFNIKNQPKEPSIFSCPMTLTKANILLVNVETLVKLDGLKSCDFYANISYFMIGNGSHVLTNI